MGKGSAQEEESEEAGQQITSEGPAEAGVECSAPEAAMPQGVAGTAEMAIDTRAPVLSGTVPAQCTDTLASSTPVSSLKGCQNTEA